MDDDTRNALRDLARSVDRLEDIVKEHDLKARGYASELQRASSRQADISQELSRAVDRISDHLGRIETLLEKFTNGTGNKLVWFLAGAVVLAALGDRALQFLLQRVGG